MRVKMVRQFMLIILGGAGTVACSFGDGEATADDTDTDAELYLMGFNHRNKTFRITGVSFFNHQHADPTAFIRWPG